MTIVIDSITHQLNATHIAKKLVYAFTHNAPSVQVMIPAHETLRTPGNIRNALSRYFRERKIPAHERFGLGISEPFPASFGDDRVGKYVAFTITPYYSTTRHMGGVLNDLFKETDMLKGVDL